MERYDIRELLNYIDPRDCSYEEWLAVGMGLKEDGYAASDWEAWSIQDRDRYHAGECDKKWNSFRGMAGSKITAGTIVQMARDRGWRPDPGAALDWDSEISTGSDGKVVDPEWLEAGDLKAGGLESG